MGKWKFHQALKTSKDQSLIVKGDLPAPLGYDVSFVGVRSLKIILIFF